MDLLEFGMKGLELLPDPPDSGSNIDSIPVFATSRHEAHAMHAIVDLPVRDERTDFRGQQVDNLELRNRQANIDLVPIGPAGPSAQRQAATLEDSFHAGDRTALRSGGGQTQAGGEDRRVSRLVHEIGCAALERKSLEHWVGLPGQEDDGPLQVELCAEVGDGMKG